MGGAGRGATGQETDLEERCQSTKRVERARARREAMVKGSQPWASTEWGRGGRGEGGGEAREEGRELMVSRRDAMEPMTSLPTLESPIGRLAHPGHSLRNRGSA